MPKNLKHVKKIGIIVKIGNDKAMKLGDELAEWLTEKGYEMFGEPGLAESSNYMESVPSEEICSKVDMLLILGGDGTILYGARLLSGKPIPLLGINLGGLGFLSASVAEDVYVVMERFLEDDLEVEERMMLDVKVLRNNEVIATYKALNDVVIKANIARLICLDTRVDNEFVAKYRADGLIIATPSGSTAYSLSADGPILYPTIDSIIIAPICPFNLTKRPVVIPDWMPVDILVNEDQPSMLLTLDGQLDMPLAGLDIVKVRKSPDSFYLVKYDGKSFFEILRERLMWEVKNTD